MANKRLFDSRASSMAATKPATDAVNEAGGRAYKFTPKHGLAQYAVTGCLNSTYYTSEEDQLNKVLELCKGVPAEFIAKVAVYARTKGFMKDMPALLCAVLAREDIELLKKVFPKVVDNGKMLRTFIQIMRSGVVGRKSITSRAIKRLVLNWLVTQNADGLFKQSIGNDPSMADVVRMVHPTPADKQQEALYGYLLGKKEYNKRNLPPVVKAYEAFKSGKSKEVPDVPFQFLSSLEIGPDVWKVIAQNASWQTVRMNLNTFARHNVYEDKEIVKALASKLRDPKEVARARVFPYQLLTAYLNTDDSVVPRELRNALQDAMELAVNNVPAFEGQVYVFPDVSGSMSAPVTGHRKGATSKARCIDVAALVAASVLRRNPDAEVLPFATDVVKLKLNPRDSIMTNAEKLAKIGGGGTSCSTPLALLNRNSAKGDLCIYVSDSESWVDSGRSSVWGGDRSTATMAEWSRFTQRNRDAKLVCIDIQAYGTTQVSGKDNPNILNIGGFSDQVFNVIGAFATSGLDAGKWISMIEAIEL